jgi:RimJ/RimL family protein N-acetyltransferase
MVLIGDFCYLIGSCVSEEEQEIVELLSALVKNKIMILNSTVWQPVLDKLKQNNQESFRGFLRYALVGKKEWFDQEKLVQWANAIEPEYKAVRIDDTIYPLTQKQFWTEDFCSNFESKEDFMKYGIGYVVLKDNEIISGASTYSYDGERLEITIETKEEYRKKGLAIACAAKLILDSLARNIYPRWDAANLTSVRLAEKLGYRFAHEYTVYTF